MVHGRVPLGLFCVSSLLGSFFEHHSYDDPASEMGVSSWLAGVEAGRVKLVGLFPSIPCRSCPRDGAVFCPCSWSRVAPSLPSVFTLPMKPDETQFNRC